LSLLLTFCFINQDYRLVRMPYSPLTNSDWHGLFYLWIGNVGFGSVCDKVLNIEPHIFLKGLGKIAMNIRPELWAENLASLHLE
jgi:hypothetical protein